MPLKIPRIRDEAYLAYIRTLPCEACGLPDGSDAAHIRVGHEGGMGLRPPDNLVLALCRKCHAVQETGGYEWLVETILKPQLRRRHKNWKANGTPDWRGRSGVEFRDVPFWP